MVSRALQILFFALIVYPVVLVVLGLRIMGSSHLPEQGPAIIVANHNSHLDTLVLMCLFRLRNLKKIRPVAAADYFLKSKFMSWFSLNIIGIIPLKRKIENFDEDPLQPIHDVLAQDQIVIFYPEGSRGQPEIMSEFKKGIAHLIVKNPDVPVVPVYMVGLGKSLPKGDPLLVPFFLDIFIGQALSFKTKDKNKIVDQVEEAVKELIPN